MPTTAPTRRGTGRRAALALAGAALATLAACGAAPEAAPPPTTEAGPAVELTRSDVDAWLDETIPAALEDGRIAGASVAVVHDGEVLTARGFGQADVDAGTPVDPDRTLFRTGSVSKLVTATAVMQLVEAGEVDLDTDVQQYTGLDLGLEHPVTLRHLLTHTAGFEERVAGLIGTDTTPDLRASLVTDPPEQVYEPGTTPAYSNFGNALAGYVVEAVTGTPFEEYVARNVLEPAGMTSSSFAQPLPAHLAGDVAQGYPTSDDDALPFEVVGQPPAGALSATATDMARFMLLHLGQAQDTEVLSEPTRELMMEPALDADALGILAEGPRMGLGWFDESRHGHRVVGHGGDTTAFHSHLQLWPDDGTGLYLSFNSTGADGAAYLLRDALLEDFADRYYPGPAPESTVPADVRAEHAEALAGSYESTRGFHSTFLTAVGPLEPTRAEVVDGDTVRFTPGPGQLDAAEYTEIEPWVYQQVGGDRVLTVRTDADGRVELIGHDSAMSMVPVTAARSAALPALAGGAVVLLLTAIAWPVGAVVRRVRARRSAVGTDVPGPREAAGAPSPARLPHRFTRVAAVVTVVALAGWVAVVLGVMGLQPVPALAIRAVQVLTVVGVLGLIPAAWRVVAEARMRTGWFRIGAASIVLIAFAVTSVAVNQLQLLSFDITY